MLTVILATLVLLLGSLNLLASLALMLVNLPVRSAQGDPFHAVLPSPTSLPFVSVHVAIHDEPADLVIATLEALARSDYPAFEVIVVDNNTPDPATWIPVSKRVGSLGERFRFYHFDGVEGAKAGALNLALELSDPGTAYVAIVDADYQVASDFIVTAVAACGPTVQFVQFPQAYRCATGADDVVSELSAYFAIFPRAANRTQASLLTGTLSMISIEALRQVGGWPTRSITEDAELGLLLWSAGARGRYIDREAGHGLLPMDLAGLRLQRIRWVTGNIQTLIGGRQALLRAPAGFLAVLAQLTAWLGLLAVPLATLILVALARAWPTMGNAAPTWMLQSAELIASATFICAFVGHGARAIVRGRIGSIAVSSALLWSSSFGWLPALHLRRLSFRRTPKVPTTAGSKLSIDAICSFVALGAAGLFAVEGSSLTAVILLLGAGGLVTAPIVDRSLRRAAESGATCKA
ncbi:MAG: glycosyltransferase family 2 protein [Sphingomonas sp.]